MDKPLNGVTLKKISSGGDGIQARVNFKDEIEFVLQPLVILAANDFPAITAADDALSNRAAYFDMPNVYLEPDMIQSYKGDKIVKETDSSIKDVWAKNIETAEALFALLVDSYSETKPPKPASVVQTSKEWTSTDSINEKIKDLFEVKQDSYILTKNMFKAVVANGIQVSSNKLGRIMTILGFPSDQKTVNGQTFRAYWGINLKNNHDF